MSEETYDTEEFRDHIGTINEEGKRNWIFPKKPSGRFYNARTWVSILLLAFLFGAPWLRVNGEPFMLFNVLERKFILFGIVFWPQDFHLFFLAMITGVIFIVLFTVVYGRIFCGWICPQTIFMEMVFRKIEFRIDGDRGQQMRLAKKKWNDHEKLRKRALKHTIFWITSFAIANTFLAYLISTDELLLLVEEGPIANPGTFVALIIFTTVFYFVFSRLREQVCIVVCPYGRLQGVMLDRNSIVVAYDHKRGERENGRAKWRKNEDRLAAGKGDCIDCGACVDVCPTGIDIRNGTQLECVNCTACIDACDSIMERVELPKGLIRYASEENIVKGTKPKMNTRRIAYTAVLVLMVTITTGFLLSRSDLEATFLRVPGMLYRAEDDGRISNLYNFKLINKSHEEIPVRVELLEPEGGEVMLIGMQDRVLPVGEYIEGTMFVYIERDDLESQTTKIKIGVYSGDELIETFKTNFNGPVK